MSEIFQHFSLWPLGFNRCIIKELETCNTVTYVQNFRNERIETWGEINLGIEFFKLVVDVLFCFSGREA
jgi:hypothetical protein